MEKGESGGQQIWGPAPQNAPTLNGVTQNSDKAIGLEKRNRSQESGMDLSASYTTY